MLVAEIQLLADVFVCACRSIASMRDAMFSTKIGNARRGQHIRFMMLGGFLRIAQAVAVACAFEQPKSKTCSFEWFQ